MYSSGYPPPREGVPPPTSASGQANYTAPPTSLSQLPPAVQYPAAGQPTYPPTYSFTQFPPPGIPGVGLPGYPVSSQHYPSVPGAVATSTAPPHYSSIPVAVATSTAAPLYSAVAVATSTAAPHYRSVAGAVATSTAPASHPTQHYPPGSVSGAAPAYTTHLATSNGANTSIYPQYPPSIPAVGAYSVPGYPAGVPPPVTNTQPPQWQHSQFQESY